MEDEREHRLEDGETETDAEDQSGTEDHWVVPTLEALTKVLPEVGPSWVPRTTITSSSLATSTMGRTSAEMNIPVGFLETLTSRPMGRPCGKKPMVPAVRKRSPSCHSSVRWPYSSLQRVRSPVPFTVARARVRSLRAGTAEVGLTMSWMSA